jgi:Predicted membrane protein
VSGKMLTIHDLPTVNAILNVTSGLLLICGYAFIRRRNIDAHKVCMLGAVFASALFLTSYGIYHAHAGATKFAGTGWVRPLYFAILISHSALAALIVPMVLVTLFRALKGDFQRHRAIARWTLPIWLYVSVTGVLIYLMLYHLFPSR